MARRCRREGGEERSEVWRGGAGEEKEKEERSEVIWREGAGDEKERKNEVRYGEDRDEKERRTK